MDPQAIAVRAVLTNDGFSDIHVEVRRNSPVSFTVTENGTPHPFWRTFSPQQLITGNCPAMSMDEAWQRLVVERFPGYVATNVEELSVTHAE